MADHLRAELALDALLLALATRRPAGGQLVHHTDRDGQYSADRSQAVLHARGLLCSMSRAGNCCLRAACHGGAGCL